MLSECARILTFCVDFKLLAFSFISRADRACESPKFVFVWNPGFVSVGEMVPNIEHLHLMLVLCISWTFRHLPGKHAVGLRQKKYESVTVIRITSLMDC